MVFKGIRRREGWGKPFVVEKAEHHCHDDMQGSGLSISKDIKTSNKYLMSKIMSVTDEKESFPK